MLNSYFMLGILLLNIIPWVLGTAFSLGIKNQDMNQDIKKGWRGFIESVGQAGLWAFFFGSSLGGAAATLNRPFRGGEFMAVVLIGLSVFAVSTVCVFIPDWLPVSNDVDSTE